MAIVDALSYMASTNFNLFPNIILKSDFKAVIYWLNNVLDSPWKYNNLINKLQNLYLDLRKFSFVHVFRKVNHFVDSLVKMGVHRTSDLVAW